MKEIKKEKQTTYYLYEAVDGTVFTSQEECVEYEKTAKCVLQQRFNRLDRTKDYNSWDLLGGLDDPYCIWY